MLDVEECADIVVDDWNTMLELWNDVLEECSWKGIVTRCSQSACLEASTTDRPSLFTYKAGGTRGNAKNYMPRIGDVVVGVVTSSRNPVNLKVQMGPFTWKGVVSDEQPCCLTLPLLGHVHHGQVLSDEHDKLVFVGAMMPTVFRNIFNFRIQCWRTDKVAVGYGSLRVGDWPTARDLPSWIRRPTWKEMVARKRVWQEPLLEELMQKACHPTRFSQIMELD